MTTNSNFPLSARRNKLAVVGCDSLAVIGGLEGRNYSAGCISMCNQINDVVNGSCSGVGCCQMSIPEDVIDFAVSLGSLNDHKEVFDFNPCDYSFVVEDDAYEFSSLDLKDLQKRESVPLILDWAIGNLSCEEAQLQKDDNNEYGCRDSNSFCLNSTNGVGYRCNCSHGYQGNPYLINGCQDINECDGDNPCVGSCINLAGSFSCSCPKGSKGDGTKMEQAALLFLLLTILCLYRPIATASGLFLGILGTKEKKAYQTQRTVFPTKWRNIITTTTCSSNKVVNEGNIEQLKAVANVAKSCLRVNGEERPSMKEVANPRLEHIHGGHDDHDQNPNSLIVLEEAEFLLRPNSSNVGVTEGFDSMNIQMFEPYDDGR
ncbi:hypothetical protein F8388_025978 [Cannabis sativa]|uniref:EGF-like domain-containing protein n=1 Tax=Cannabis sativa TaxID=3483 RepID=A0A7J6EC17_CANSA|nr:hypothetical protein F8388_025978 [Cannabis sativa]